MTVRRFAQVLALCGVAALGVISTFACNPTPRPSNPPAAPVVLSLEIPNNAFGSGFSGVTAAIQAKPEVPATATMPAVPATPANYFVLPLLTTTAPIVRVVLELPTNSVVSITATDVSGSQTVMLPVISPPGPNSPGPTSGYAYLYNITSNSSTYYIRYPNAFQGSESIRTMITATVGGVASAPLTFDMSFRGSNLTVSIATENNDGRVTSNPPGIDCPGVCRFPFLNTSNVVLTQSVLHNQTQFMGWTGSCVGAGNSCTVSLFASGNAIIPGIPLNPAVTANFRIHTNEQSGVDEITLSRSTDPGDDQFVYKNPLLIFMPEDALVTSVTNVSRDVNGNGVKLELVRHTDANGVLRTLPAANCPSAPLEPQAATSAFNGLTVKGEWKVRAVCISQVFLNNPPARIALRINWTR